MVNRLIDVYQDGSPRVYFKDRIDLDDTVDAFHRLELGSASERNH
jgi:hypothetical protein